MKRKINLGGGGGGGLDLCTDAERWREETYDARRNVQNVYAYHRECANTYSSKGKSMMKNEERGEFRRKSGTVGEEASQKNDGRAPHAMVEYNPSNLRGLPRGEGGQKENRQSEDVRK